MSANYPIVGVINTKTQGNLHDESSQIPQNDIPHKGSFTRNEWRQNCKIHPFHLHQLTNRLI